MKQLWSEMSGPLKIGLIVGLIGALLTVIGLIKGGFAPLTPWSLFFGVLIGGGVWGLVSWAIATAASDGSKLPDQ